MSNTDDSQRNAVTDPTVLPPKVDEKADGTKAYRGVGILPSVIVGFVLVLAVIIFLAQNTNRVQVSFLGWNGNVALAVVVLVVAFAAVVIGEIAGWFVRVKYRRMKNEREELKRLRNSH